MSFWQNLKKPIIGLAPMDGVTDYPFRRIVKKYGPKCDLFFTEFVHVKSLSKGKIKVYQDLVFDKSNKPVIAQLFGSTPEYFYQAAIIICTLGFDGIDINMGCPARNVVRRDGGAALIKKPELAAEIIKETKKGVGDWVNGKNIEDLNLDEEKLGYINNVETHCNASQKQAIPVSVKTRLGYDKNIISDWIDYLINAKPDAITVHGRTFAQEYSGQADWDAIASVSDKVKKAGITYLGNGDIKSYGQALDYCQKYNTDGILIGRAAFGNPWIFSDQTPNLEERFQVMFEHARYFNDFHDGKYFYAFRKHLGWYCKGFDGAKSLRLKLMKCESLNELENTIQFD